MQRRLTCPPARPVLLRQPHAGSVARICIGRGAVEKIGAIGRIILGTVRDILQPTVPPAQRLLQKTDLRPRHGGVRILVDPRADDPLGRNREVRHQMRDRIHVVVGPATDRQHRRFDRVIVLANRAMLPIGIARLMAGPERRKERLVLKPLDPILAPIVAQHRVGRARGIGQHDCAPAEVFP